MFDSIKTRLIGLSVGVVVLALCAATIANPTPVLPLVGSTIVPPGCRRPSRSAARIISSAGRSFAEPPGFVVSIFMTSTDGMSWISLIRFSRTSGVLPMRSITLSAMWVPWSRESDASSPQAMGAQYPAPRGVGSGHPIG